MELKIHKLDSHDFAGWDSYVESRDDATFFHKAGWKTVIERAFKHKTHFLYVTRQDKIEGILPLVYVKSALFGRSLSSMPFAVYGGIVASNKDAADLLRAEACKLADSLKVVALEFRNSQPSDSGWPSKDLYSTFRKQLDTDNDVNLKAIPNRQRAMIRKGIAAGLQSEEVAGIDRIYNIYSESVRNLGTPVFAKKYLQILQEVFGDQCRVLMITHQDNDIAGVLSFYFQDQVLPYYGGSIALARSVKGTNDFMYWELLRRSVDEGIRVYDFGRSKKGTGPYRFKKNWGFAPQDLHYEYYLVKAQTVPEVNPTNPKYQMMIKAWKKLPLPVANFIGPFLAKNLG
jgi:FemAB-related protein (PEP-CTERM system-associated)